MMFPTYNSDAYYQPEDNDVTDADYAELDKFVERVLILIRESAEDIADTWVDEAATYEDKPWMRELAAETISEILKGLHNNG